MKVILTGLFLSMIFFLALFHKHDHVIKRLLDGIVGKPFAEQKLVDLDGKELRLCAERVVLDVVKVGGLHGTADTTEVRAGGETETLPENVESQ